MLQEMRFFGGCARSRWLEGAAKGPGDTVAVCGRAGFSEAAAIGRFGPLSSTKTPTAKGTIDRAIQNIPCVQKQLPLELVIMGRIDV
jgi:hypothetical protein